VRAVSDLERGVSQVPRPSTLQLLTRVLDLDESDAARFLAAAHGGHPQPAPTAERLSPLSNKHTSTPELPSGTVTFLFTDLEAHTQLWETDPEAMRAALARHDAILRAAVVGHNGYVVKGTGDGLHAAFARATDALGAAIDGQRGLTAEAWPLPRPLRARMGLHTGAVEVRDGDYFGLAVNRAARVMQAAQGGQVLLSLVTAQLVRGELARGVALRDLGEHQLKDLRAPERLYQVVLADLPDQFPPMLRRNLPRQLSSFVGREHELAELEALLQTSPLLTLTGPGGIGKTRLAIQALQCHDDADVTAVYWVELAGFIDPADLCPTLAQALGIRERMGQPLQRTIVDELRSSRALLILDNCEHLIDSAASLVRTLLTECTSLRIVVTSREPLGIEGERVLRIAPMATDAFAAQQRIDKVADSDAVRLYVDRVRAGRADFELTTQNVRKVIDVCQRLDGIPLALELAAARARYLSLDEIIARLDREPSFLRAHDRSAPRRHRSVDETIEWSYRLLDTKQQRLFVEMSIFAGGAALESIEAVCTSDDGAGSQIVDTLGQLVDQSLVQAESLSDGTQRYRLLEPLRQFAALRLHARDDANEMHERHAREFLRFAETGQQAVWSYYGLRVDRFHLLARERDNLRAALEWLIAARGFPEALRLATVLTWFWMVHGLEWEHLDRLISLLALAPPENSRERATALRAVGRLAWQCGDYKTRLECSNQALAIFRELGDQVGIVLALQDLASVATHLGQLDRASILWSETLDIIDRGNVPVGLRGRSLMGLAAIARDSENFDRAHELYAAARLLIPHYSPTGSSRMFEAEILTDEGILAMYQGDTALARRLLEQSGVLIHGPHDMAESTSVPIVLGWVALVEHDLPRARASFHECMPQVAGFGDRRAQALLLEGLAALYGATSPEEAVRCASLAEVLRAAMGRLRTAPEQRLIDSWLAPARQQLAPRTIHDIIEGTRSAAAEALVTECLANFATQ
jgi:predicted ATPase/class 3 adenylate cyclase